MFSRSILSLCLFSAIVTTVAADNTSFNITVDNATNIPFTLVTSKVVPQTAVTFDTTVFPPKTTEVGVGSIDAKKVNDQHNIAMSFLLKLGKGYSNPKGAIAVAEYFLQDQTDSGGFSSHAMSDVAPCQFAVTKAKAKASEQVYATLFTGSTLFPLPPGVPRLQGYDVYIRIGYQNLDPRCTLQGVKKPPVLRVVHRLKSR